MAKAKFKKYPKIPKASASVEVKERWLQKAKEVDKYNAEVERKKKRSEELDKKIRNYKRKK